MNPSTPSNDRLSHLAHLARRLFLILGCVLMVGLSAGGSARAEGPTDLESSWGYDLGHDLMSPYCPGRTLATCPSPQAAELIQWIVLQESAGATRDEVLEQLVERFGEEILGAPKAEGAGLWAYILPVAGFIVGGGLAFLALRRIVAGSSGSSGNADSADAPGATDPGTAAPADSSSSSLSASEACPAPPDGEAAPLDEEELARIVDEDLKRRA